MTEPLRRALPTRPVPRTPKPPKPARTPLEQAKCHLLWRQRLGVGLRLLAAIAMGLAFAAIMLILSRSTNISQQNRQILKGVTTEVGNADQQIADLNMQLNGLRSQLNGDQVTISDLQVKNSQLQDQVSSEYQQLLARGQRPVIVTGPSAPAPTTTTAPRRTTPSTAPPVTLPITTPTTRPTPTTTTTVCSGILLGSFCLP